MAFYILSHPFTIKKKRYQKKAVSPLSLFVRKLIKITSDWNCKYILSWVNMTALLLPNAENWYLKQSLQYARGPKNRYFRQLDKVN